MIDVPVEVKDALREGRLKKNYRVVVLDDEGAEDFTIDNNNLVSESVNIDERMCSGNKIKFGLCEGSSLEFQYFGFPSILGRRLQVFIDVDYGAENPYVIPMGYFDVQKCSRQASTGIIKVTAYNKLMSEYLDAKANELLLNTIGNSELPILVYDIQNLLLNEYQIQPEQEVYQNVANRLRSYIDLGMAAKLTSNTLTVTPINYYNLLYIPGKAWNTTFYLWPLPNAWTWTCDPTKYYTFKSSFDLGAWEHELVEYLRNLIDLSQLNKTSEQFFDWIISQEGGWLHIFGIEILYADNTTQVFSDEAYSRGAATGKFSDIINKTFTNVSEVSLWLINDLIVNEKYESQVYSTYAMLSIDGPDYQYYTDSLRRDGTYPTFKFPDGTDLPNYGAGGRVEPIPDWFQVYLNAGMDDAEKVSIIPSQSPDFTLREIISADYETVCQFGQLDRITDLFSGVELNHSRLYPQETLYPDNALYPEGAQASATKSMYSQLWADEGNVRKWRNLLITYKGLNDQQQEKDFVYTAEINPDGTDDYDCSDNWLFRNLVWTQAQIEEYADAMVEKMQDMTWFPFEMWCPGLPYLETGDEIEIPLGQNSYTSYVLQRQLKGIQNLQDTYINGTLDIF